MFKGIIASAQTGVLADTNIKFTKVLNTNSNTIWNESDSTLSIVNSGYYDVNVVLYVTGVTTDIEVEVLNNGNPIAETLVGSSASATTTKVTLPIVDTIKVVNDIPTNRVNLSVRFGGTTTTATITSGVFIVEKRR